MAVYAARNTKGVLSVGMAISKNEIHGPWEDIGAPLVENVTEGNIDPTITYDRSTGDLYLVWKVDGNANGQPTPILARKLVRSGDKVSINNPRRLMIVVCS